MKKTKIRIIFSAMVEVESTTGHHFNYQGFAYKNIDKDFKLSSYKGIDKTGTYYFAGNYPLEDGQDSLDFVESTWLPKWKQGKKLNISNIEIIKTTQKIEFF